MSARAAALLAWYGQHRREMPWRRAEGQADPYAVLVSELMLQQTRVDTVVPFFLRWMARWPTVAALAAASTEEVLAAWTGLGYYNRARNLHRAAQVVVARHGGKLPAEAAALAALPGVGPYTLGAIRSIAFGAPAPLVDGNVARVLSRWQASRLPPASAAGKKALWALATTLVAQPPAALSPGDWNQALMELGATLCMARAPGCTRCPVATWCAAHADGVAAELPVRVPKRKPTVVAATYLLWRRADGHIWCGRRAETGRWAGLWEPPGMEGDDAETQVRAWVADQPHLRALPTVVHVLTHRRYEVTPLLVLSEAPPPNLAALGYVASRWCAPDASRDVNSGLSRLAGRLLEASENTVNVDTGAAVRQTVPVR